jgi:DNA-binding HxlR family transcriptional regulator
MEDVEGDRQRAEVFDALGHPTRILILKAVSEGSMGFADLKKKINVDSSGQLQHHLNKLNGLIKTDEYGKYCLSDQGKDAFHTVQLVENTKQIKKNRINRFKTASILKSLSILLVTLLIVSSAVALLEYNQTMTLQKEILQNNQDISRLQAQLDSSLNTIPAVSTDPQYLHTVADLAGNSNLTKIYLVSANGRYDYWRFNDTQIGYPLSGSYIWVIHKGDPLFVINVTVRNDYTSVDSRNYNSNDYNSPISNITGTYESFIVLNAFLYDAEGNVINAVDFTMPKTPIGMYQFSLIGQETVSFNLYLATANRDIDHFAIKIGYLASTPQP